MRQTGFVILAACILMLAPTACSVNDKALKPETTTVASMQPFNSGASDSQDQAALTGIESSAGVVAKSNNIVSGQDNGQVMKELDKELDALFASINKLEDLEESGLAGEGVEE